MTVCHSILVQRFCWNGCFMFSILPRYSNFEQNPNCNKIQQATSQVLRVRHFSKGLGLLFLSPFTLLSVCSGDHFKIRRLRQE